MKTILTCFLALSFLTTAFAQQALQNPTDISNTFFKAMQDEDNKTLSTLIANDMTFTNFDGGTIDGDSLIQTLSDGSFTLETATVSDAQTRQYTSDATLTTGEWKVKGTLQGNGFDDTVFFSVLCVRQGNKWKIVYVQLTPIRQ